VSVWIVSTWTSHSSRPFRIRSFPSEPETNTRDVLSPDPAVGVGVGVYYYGEKWRNGAQKREQNGEQSREHSQEDNSRVEQRAK
jgi:hypothetical protein